MPEPFPTGEPAGMSPSRKVDLQICHVGMGGYIITGGTFYLRMGDALSPPLFACTTLDEALAFIRENIKLHAGKPKAIVAEGASIREAVRSLPRNLPTGTIVRVKLTPRKRTRPAKKAKR